MLNMENLLASSSLKSSWVPAKATDHVLKFSDIDDVVTVRLSNRMISSVGKAAEVITD